jgi:glycerate kinase
MINASSQLVRISPKEASARIRPALNAVRKAAGRGAAGGMGSQSANRCNRHEIVDYH